MKLSLQKIAKLAVSSSCPTPPPFSPIWPWSQAHSLVMTSLLNPHGSLSSATSPHSRMVVRSRLNFAIVGVGRRTINEAWDVYKWIFLNFKINSRTEIQWMEQISKLHDFHATLWLEWQEEEKGTKENIWIPPLVYVQRLHSNWQGRNSLGGSTEFTTSLLWCEDLLRARSSLSLDLCPKSVLHLTQPGPIKDWDPVLRWSWALKNGEFRWRKKVLITYLEGLVKGLKTGFYFFGCFGSSLLCAGFL